MRKDTLETVPLEELDATTGGCGGIIPSLDDVIGPVIGKLETVAGPILDIFKPFLPGQP
jgi:hypothetical protein